MNNMLINLMKIGTNAFQANPTNHDHHQRRWF